MNGLVVILSILLILFFTHFSQLKCPLFFRLVPVTCFIYSLFSFFPCFNATDQPFDDPSRRKSVGYALHRQSRCIYVAKKNKQNKKHFEA